MTSFRYLSVDYYATGQGISYWLQITNRNDYESDVDSFKKFIDSDFFSSGIEEKEKDDFILNYTTLIPDYVKKIVNKEGPTPNFCWRTHLHLNFS